MPEITEALGKLEQEFKTQQKDISAKIDKHGENSAEVKNHLAQVEAVLGKQMDEVKSTQEGFQQSQNELKQSVKGVQTALNRIGNNLECKDATPEAILKLREFVTEGKCEDVQIAAGNKPMVIGTKSLTVGNDPQAGYLVDPVMGSMFDETVTEFSPIRQVAEVVKISGGDSYERPVNKKGGVGAAWESEVSTSSNTGAPSVGMQNIPVHALRASVYASTQFLDDAANAESWLMTEASEDFATVQNAAYFLGDGVGKPRGLLTYGASDISQVNSGSSTTFTTDGILALMGALKAPYRAAANFMANRTSIFTHLFTLKDEENRHFLVPDFRNGLTFRLVGTPLLEAPDMPNVTGDALSLVYGDFRRGYTIVDRTDMTVLRDPFSAKPFVEFWVRGRFGGDVAVKEAIALQKISA